MRNGSHHFVITGTSGTGKTALVDELSARGHRAYEEPTRKVLREQLAIDGPALPAKDPTQFLDAMLEYCVHCLAEADRADGPCFFDRGIPDLIAYAIRFGVDPARYVQAAREHRYASTVFVLPPWERIFVADEFRRLTFAQYVEFHELIVTAYADAGYELLEVPRVPLNLRTAFMVDAIAGEAE